MSSSNHFRCRGYGLFNDVQTIHARITRIRDTQNTEYRIHKVLYKYAKTRQHTPTEARNQHESSASGGFYARISPETEAETETHIQADPIPSERAHRNREQSGVCIAVEPLVNTFNEYLWASIRNEWLLPSLNFIWNGSGQVPPTHERTDYNEEDINMFWGREAGVQQPGLPKIKKNRSSAESFPAHVDFLVSLDSRGHLA